MSCPERQRGLGTSSRNSSFFQVFLPIFLGLGAGTGPPGWPGGKDVPAVELEPDFPDFPDFSGFPDFLIFLISLISLIFPFPHLLSRSSSHGTGIWELHQSPCSLLLILGFLSPSPGWDWGQGQGMTALKVPGAARPGRVTRRCRGFSWCPRCSLTASLGHCHRW